MNDFLYPPSPVAVNEEKLAPPLSFKKQVGKVVISIILFFMVYILLVLAAVALAIGCFYAGGAIIIAIPRIFTVIIGLGLIGVGISVIFFLVKFIFAISKDENPSRVEIKEADQPRLFAFIRQLSKETQTPFPKKIFISPDVNACVFYNSSFWSMFLPVRKNLEIGLGLVNSINISEFKAVIAHEFGHFSQRSMKLGSFTYNVNRIIYNMLYDNRSYAAFLNAWGNVHSYLRFFASITARIANGIQWILRGMYKFINNNYMGLSREMEFHADAVAASVSGGNNLISSLSRIEVAEGCYRSALNNANDWLKQNKISKNIFNNQLSILRSWAKEHALPLKQGLPEVSYQFIQSISKSRINYKNQWASHPTLEERKINLEKLSMNIDPDETNAWGAFVHADKLQEQMTDNLYRSVKLEGNSEKYDTEHFEEWHLKEKDKYALPSAYMGFYNNRYIDAKDWNMDSMVSTGTSKNFNQLFNKENASLQSSINNNQNDLALVKAIKEKQIDVKSFDFDGVKHVVADCDEIMEKIEKEIAEQKEQQQLLDKEVFIFFYNHAKEKSCDIKSSYQNYQSVYRNYDEYVEEAKKVLDAIQPYYEGGLTLDQITLSIADLRMNYENKLKNTFNRLLEKKIISIESNEELHNKVKNFIGRNYAYFISNQFQNDELNELRDLTIKVAEEFNEYKYRQYKKLLEDQLTLYNIPVQPNPLPLLDDQKLS